MFERFTEEARQVVVRAQQEARELRHNYIGTEHILLGLVAETESVTAAVLASFGLTLERARSDVIGIVGSGDSGSANQIPFTPRAKKVLELSLREALSLGHDWIGTEHILLGILREGEGVAAQLLRDAGAQTDELRTRVIGAVRVAIRPPRASVAGGSHDRPRRSIDAAWLEGWNQDLLEGLAIEIRRELHRDPDVGDLLLVLGHAPDFLAGRVLVELGVDLDVLWGTIERVRGERAEAASELERRREAVRQAKEEAIEAQKFDEAAQLRDQERELVMRLRARWEVGPEVPHEIRRRLGLPEPPSLS